MKPRRPPTAILFLFVAVLAAWLVFRPRPTPPPPMGDTPTRHEDAATPPVLPAPSVAAAPALAVPRSTPVADVAEPAPAAAASSPAVAAAATPHAEPTTVAPPDAVSPEASRTDAASVNAIRVRRMVTDYHTLTGENPVGTNAEIMAAIMGQNPREAVLGPPDGVELNRGGELVDEWGTPYFFHQLSRDLMEIHSAGPDKIMGTADDIVVR